MSGLTIDEIMAQIRPETVLLPGIAADAYTLLAGALSTFKSTFLHGLLVSKATGFDVYGLCAGSFNIEPGPVLLLSYEDADWRIVTKLQRVLQRTHAVIRQAHGAARAAEFLSLAAMNIHRKTLSGHHGAGVVHRDAVGLVAPNRPLIDELLREVRTVSTGGVLVGLDPLRLAIVGSQNDDDGADVVVHTLNSIVNELPGSGLIVASHSTKQGAQEPGDGYTGASYATSGSALYSQHARSNFLMHRLRADDVRDKFDGVTDEEAERQRVVKVVHGRLSHGVESDDVYLLMRVGVLERVHKARTGAIDVKDQMLAALPKVVAAIDKLTADSMRASETAIINTGLLSGSKPACRDVLQMLDENGYITFAGKTKTRTGAVTSKGRNAVRDAGRPGFGQ